ncbi:Transmembrane channel-like protein 2-B [Dissostichus eleginoides]|uniref:Transmembrane channel-like protein 2-B n=1 Tax=Dissostichus eleginoides TaxID=100907 RepID=A0AAD9CNY0_DISEL|nr:Transmembrane channel-like protein 2-B [Dissostichus eleginoides]
MQRTRRTSREHAGNTQNTQKTGREHAGNTQRTRKQAENTQETRREHAENTQRTRRKHAENTQNKQRTSREHAGNTQNRQRTRRTRREHAEETRLRRGINRLEVVRVGARLQQVCGQEAGGGLLGREAAEEPEPERESPPREGEPRETPRCSGRVPQVARGPPGPPLEFRVQAQQVRDPEPGALKPGFL